MKTNSAPKCAARMPSETGFSGRWPAIRRNAGRAFWAPKTATKTANARTNRAVQAPQECMAPSRPCLPPSAPVSSQTESPSNSAVRRAARKPARRRTGAGKAERRPAGTCRPPSEKAGMSAPAAAADYQERTRQQGQCAHRRAGVDLGRLRLCKSTGSPADKKQGQYENFPHIRILRSLNFRTSIMLDAGRLNVNRERKGIRKAPGGNLPAAFRKGRDDVSSCGGRASPKGRPPARSAHPSPSWSRSRARPKQEPMPRCPRGAASVPKVFAYSNPPFRNSNVW